ncbi:alpha-glucuronidase precursor [Fusarium oxysporum Fo47]|uniref:Alpha-glucuronidase n=1 Tax=Fusarium oxysporum Fo47 TaxID=660027 RepID=W9K506_FUSOX|nr:alpha-glucuronidase precursor [Fusarium oxysporum Fo47]EWZ36508.1 alpha-glucuronidase [Fusarium oxysporum Fo47]QKD53886.1 alpha-glucuronidase precursor [Fusarium oxysporum Fo47]
MLFRTAVVSSLALYGLAVAETGIDGWLRDKKLPYKAADNFKNPKSIITQNATKSSPVYTAGTELQDALAGIFGEQVPRGFKGCDHQNSIIVGTLDAYHDACGKAQLPAVIEEDGFWLSIKGGSVKIVGHNERGALYGAFEYSSMLSQGNFSDISYVSNPTNAIRWTNEWDNMDGTIEGGYGGQSIFFAQNKTMPDRARVKQYDRLLASIRINGAILTNVNANPITLKPDNVRGLGEIAAILKPYGVQIGLALNFASPQTLGGLSTFDPLEPSVISWWEDITNKIYDEIPNFAAYLVKANSEGQPGPLTYNRTLAQGANVFGDVLRPHGGIVLFRTFVYEMLNITDWKADRSAEAYDAFQGLDGKFHDNIILQMKYGPLDFQVREPAHPLFGYFKNANAGIELQIAQEYLGQQAHNVYLAPLWKEILDTDLRVDDKSSFVRDIISGKRFKRRIGAFSGVANVGMSQTWTGSHLSMSNLYAFGRLAWDPTDDPEAIIKSWSPLTFGLHRQVTDIVTRITMESWPAYLNYSSRDLGLPALTDVTNNHFGPNVRAGDDNPYGIWTRSDSFSIGMDRTVSSGTGFSGQYPPAVAEKFEHIETTPTNMILWYHHVNYTHKLPTGKTVIQHLYDAHYAGAKTAHNFPKLWMGAQRYVDEERFNSVLFQLTFQAGHSIVWRDSIVDYYHNLTGITDEAGRAGHHPWRIEAEHMSYSGYKTAVLDPIESASNATALETIGNSTVATASTKLDFKPGRYDIAVVYFDLLGGTSQWEAYLNGKLLGKWVGNLESTLSRAATTEPDSGSKARITFPNVKIAKGDIFKVVGKADRAELAPLDFVAFLPQGVID